ncbi:hypothetical protein ACFWP7_29965 [Streptomyces sp. NPDC058470]|uniref:hypothetical protein n=1 Tax=unclassified Streptomyces TaxID=2593676 RepID=UPI003661B621
MRRLIRQLANWTRVFIAPIGRHRAGYPLPRVPSQTSPPEPHHTSIAATVRAWYDPIDGAATQLVRPYLHAYERDEKARLQRLRRDTLWWATYGIDLDNRDIHGWLEAA